MRTQSTLTFLLVTALVASGCVIPAGGRSTTEVGVVVPGPEVVVFAYSSSYCGDWRASYRSWSPVTIYYHSGRYYSRPIGGARAVVVYRRGGEYFFPPRERAWVGVDSRFDYRRGPTWRDHARAKQKGNKHRG